MDSEYKKHMIFLLIDTTTLFYWSACAQDRKKKVIVQKVKMMYTCIYLKKLFF